MATEATAVTHAQRCTAHGERLAAIGAERDRVTREAQRAVAAAGDRHKRETDAAEKEHTAAIEAEMVRIQCAVLAELAPLVASHIANPTRENSNAIATALRSRNAEAVEMAGEPLDVCTLGFAFAAQLIEVRPALIEYFANDHNVWGFAYASSFGIHSARVMKLILDGVGVAAVHQAVTELEIAANHVAANANFRGGFQKPADLERWRIRTTGGTRAAVMKAIEATYKADERQASAESHALYVQHVSGRKAHMRERWINGATLDEADAAALHALSRPWETQP